MSSSHRSKAFDADQFAASSAPLDANGFDYSTAGRARQPDWIIRFLLYAYSVEGSIGLYIRNASVTGLEFYEDFNLFAPVWWSEENAHCLVLGTYLRAYFEVHPDQAPRYWHNSVNSHVPKIPFSQRLGWLHMGLAGLFASKTIIRLYFSWGTVNEYLTGSGYRIVADGSDCELLQSILRAIARQEYRHGSAYAQMATDILGGDARAAQINRWLLQHLWKMVGIGIRSSKDGRQVAIDLCRDSSAYQRLARSDNMISNIAGLDGLDLLQRTALRAGYVPGTTD